MAAIHFTTPRRGSNPPPIPETELPARILTSNAGGSTENKIPGSPGYLYPERAGRGAGEADLDPDDAPRAETARHSGA